MNCGKHASTPPVWPRWALLGLALAALACGRAGSAQPPASPEPVEGARAAPADLTRSLTFAGVERSYLVHIPPSYHPDEPVPVVLVFHGGGGNARNAVRMTDFNTQADSGGFVTVYPNGSGPLAEALLTWNGGLCCGYAQENDVDDVGFVRALLDDLAAILPVDGQRIFATGMSNGAIFSYRLACELSDRIAAIGPVAATQNIDECAPSRPVSVVHFHGTADRNAPYEGGIGPDSIVRVDFAPVRDTIDFWVGRNRCSESPAVGRSGSVIHESYAPCAQGSAVELYTIDAGGHAWPGGSSPRRGADEPTQEISATALIWAFFAAHPRR